MSKYLNPRYGAMEAYVPGEQPRDKNYIKLNTNESPFPPAPSVTAALDIHQIRDLRLYSDPTVRVLREKLARLYDKKPEEMFVANGSDDILNFAFMAFGGDGAVFPDITYGFYRVFGELHGIPCREIPLKEDFSLTPEDYHNSGCMVVIANPNAPTGMSISLRDVEGIVQANSDHVVVIDEAYVDFGGTSCHELTRRYDNLLVVHTFSKSRSLAGGRLGYAMGNPGLIEDLEKLKYSTNPYNVNRLTMYLGEKTVDADDYYRDCCREIIRVREETASRLKELGFRVLPSQANFLFARHPDLDGGRFYQALRERGILVRHFSGERIRDYNRITIGTARQMTRFLEAAGEILEEAYEKR